MKSIKINDRAFTGLEAAIVLIAFVVVAAVFSYVVLGAGFFTTQKAQETVYAGSQQATSSFEIVGMVYGIAADSTADYLDYCRFVVGNTAGGTSMDITQMAVTYVDEVNRQNMDYTSATAGDLETAIKGAGGRSIWGIYKKVGGNQNNLLEKGEQFTLMMGVKTSAKTNTRFTINLLPSKGAPNALHRNVPAGLNTVNILF
ncbi:MAG: flagellin [Methanoregulaceae archaeon PtaU1.Bin222]|nr:MAG: flagellin [Methanoregulaceae archaeon PtaU1.Bin222]